MHFTISQTHNLNTPLSPSFGAEETRGAWGAGDFAVWVGGRVAGCREIKYLVRIMRQMQYIARFQNTMLSLYSKMLHIETLWAPFHILNHLKKISLLVYILYLIYNHCKLSQYYTLLWLCEWRWCNRQAKTVNSVIMIQQNRIWQDKQRNIDSFGLYVWKVTNQTPWLH